MAAINRYRRAAVQSQADAHDWTLVGVTV